MNVLDSKEIRDLIHLATSNNYSVKVYSHSVLIFLNNSLSSYFVLFPTDSGELFVSFYDFNNFAPDYQDCVVHRISADDCLSVLQHPVGTEVVLL